MDSARSYIQQITWKYRCIHMMTIHRWRNVETPEVELQADVVDANAMATTDQQQQPLGASSSTISTSHQWLLVNSTEWSSSSSSCASFDVIIDQPAASGPHSFKLLFPLLFSNIGNLSNAGDHRNASPLFLPLLCCCEWWLIDDYGGLCNHLCFSSCPSSPFSHLEFRFS